MIGALALAVALAVSGFLFARRVLLLSRLVRMGHAPGIGRSGDVPDRLRSELIRRFALAESKDRAFSERRNPVTPA